MSAKTYTRPLSKILINGQPVDGVSSIEYEYMKEYEYMNIETIDGQRQWVVGNPKQWSALPSTQSSPTQYTYGTQCPTTTTGEPGTGKTVEGTYTFAASGWKGERWCPCSGSFHITEDGQCQSVMFQVDDKLFMAGETADRILQSGQVREMRLRLKLKDVLQSGTTEQKAMAQQILDEVYS